MQEKAIIGAFNRTRPDIPEDIERFVYYISQLGGDSNLLEDFGMIDKLTEEDYKILRDFRESIADAMEIEDDNITYKTMYIIQQVEDYIHRECIRSYKGFMEN